MQLETIGLTAIAVTQVATFIYLHLYKSDNKDLRQALNKARESAKAEREAHRLKILALEGRAQDIISKVDPSRLLEDAPEPILLRSEQTIDKNAPHQRDQSVEILTVMTRSALLKKVADHVSTEVTEISPKVYKFSHSIILIPDGKD